MERRLSIRHRRADAAIGTQHDRLIVRAARAQPLEGGDGVVDGDGAHSPAVLAPRARAAGAVLDSQDVVQAGRGHLVLLQRTRNR